MRTHGKHEAAGCSVPKGRRRSLLIGRFFMMIGILATLYLLIAYVIMPILAALTPS